MSIWSARPNRARASTVSLFGYLGGRNAGDELMLEGLLDVIEPRPRLRVLAVDPASLGSAAQDACEITQVSPRAIVAAAFGSDALIRVGGTVFHDEYPSHFKRMHMRYLKQALILALFYCLRRPIALVGIGLSMPRHRTTKLALRLSLRMSSLVILRDPDSMRVASSLGFEGKANLGVDLAECIKPVPTHSPSTREPYLCVSVVDLSKYDLAADFPENVEHWVGLIEHNGAHSVDIVAMKDSPSESDYPTAHAVFEALRGSGRSVRLVGFRDGVLEIVNSISGASSVLAARYHCALMGLTSNRKVEVVVYNSKLSSLMQDFGVQASGIGLGSSDAMTTGDRDWPSDHLGRTERTLATSNLINQFLSDVIDRRQVGPSRHEAGCLGEGR